MVGDTNSEDESTGPSSLPVKRIRSGVRRRIMERLSEGRATVTQISTSTEVRLPHASAELKRLRKDGLVHSDAETGSRGACLALTARGWDTLRADEIARLQALPLESPPVGALGRLISVAEDHLLIAFVRRPEPGPLALPNTPLDTLTELDRNEVWTWIEPRERKPRWIGSETFLPVPPPPRDVDSSNISAWGAEVDVWGLQRFRLVDGSKSLRLASGSWFGGMLDSTLAPLPKQVPVEGGWRLGSLATDGPTIRMNSPVIGIGLDRLSREAILSSASPNSITISSLKFGAISRCFPLDALQSWMNIAHPRLQDSERDERFQALRDFLLETDDQQKVAKRRRVDESTMRRFQTNWGDVEWSLDSLKKGDWIDTSPLSSQAEQALMEWILYNSLEEVSIDVRHSESLASFLPSRIPEILRLILVSEWPKPPLIHRIEPHPVLSSMWSRLTFPDGLAIPLNLSAPVYLEALSEEIAWTPPQSAEQVESAQRQIGGEVESRLTPNLSATESDERLMRAAVLCFPSGNSEWANQMESRSPVVSWIASEPVDRWSRWERIGSILGPEWIGLMDPRDIPSEALSKAAFLESPSWNRKLMAITRLRIREEPEIAQTLRQSSELTDTKQAAWVARMLLSEVAWLTPELQSDLASWGLDHFLEEPPQRCAAAISGLDWLATQYPERMLSEAEDWRQSALQVGYSKPQDHDLHLWAVLSDWLDSDNRPHSSVMPLIVKHLPEEWWAPFAETILTVLSDDEDGIALISEMDIAWPSLILRPEGEIHSIPGDSSTSHGGVRRTLLTRLERLIDHDQWSEDLPGSLMIIDLSEALRAARDLTPPNFGLTHPMVRWLALPVHRWPPAEVVLMSEGDPRITARIAKMVSGWHADLSRNILDI